MKVNILRSNTENLKTGLLCVLLTEEEAKKPSGPYYAEVRKLVSGMEFSGKPGETALARTEGGVKRLLLVGIGKEKELEAEKYRRSMASCVSFAREISLESFTISARKPYDGFCKAACEGLVLSSFSFDKYRKESRDKNSRLKRADIVVEKGTAQLDRIIESAQLVCSNTNLVREVLFDNADVMNPAEVAGIILGHCRRLGIKATVIEGERLKSAGLNAIYAVGKGSQYPPRLITLEYRGNPKSKETFGLVGKGITFDSGGINLKPSGYIETMRYDKAGALAVFGAIKSAAEAGLRINVAAALPFAENIIGSRAYKPGDVIKTYSGKTVQVSNTDAEGRLVLADALAYLEKNMKPGSIVELSTLTGAVLVALGEFAAGLMTNDDRLAARLDKAGQRTYERVWRLPLYEEYKGEIEGDISDMTSLGYKDGRYAGSIIGGTFLQNFVTVPFAHIDIAGVGWFEKTRHHIQRGPTGFGVRLLFEFLSAVSSKSS